MEITEHNLQPSTYLKGGGFLNHVFSTNEESKAEIMNIAQYAFIAIIPIVLLNKSIQRFIPDVDPDASNIELLAEIIIQLLIILIGLVIIHRIISYIPTYSGYKYDPLVLTHSILPFLLTILSLQTKLGLKVNMLFERIIEMWTGEKQNLPNKQNNNMKQSHITSQADTMDPNSSILYPPLPSSTTNQRGPSTGTHVSGSTINDNMYSGHPNVSSAYPTSEYGPMPANGLIGSTF